MTLGKTLVPDFVIETIFDPHDPRLETFRDNIFSEDLGLDKTLRTLDNPHSWWLSNFDQRIAEDAYKYCDRKWNTLGFDNIEAIIEGDEIVGISGCKIYGRYLRTSMHLYLLKRVRKIYPGIKYLPGGWFERHMAYAKDKTCDGMFFTVYAHNLKLKGLINNHRGRVISLVAPEKLLYIHDIREVGEWTFNNVPQTFFYYALSDSQFNIEEVI